MQMMVHLIQRDEPCNVGTSERRPGRLKISYFAQKKTPRPIKLKNIYGEDATFYTPTRISYNLEIYIFYLFDRTVHYDADCTYI